MKKFFSLLIVLVLTLVGTVQAQNLYIDKEAASIISKSGSKLKLGNQSTDGISFPINWIEELTISATAVTIPSNTLTVTAGNVVATAGSVSAGTTVTGGTGLVATTGGATLTAGDLTLTNGALKVPAAKNLELTGESGANTACDTTCTLGCIAGWDTGTSVFVGCTNAIADTCLCTTAP